MKNILKVSAYMLAILLFLCGCGDARDINRKRIVTAVLMDVEDKTVTVYAEIANIEDGNPNGNTVDTKKYITVKGRGNSIISSREDLDINLNRKAYLGAIRTVIFTERFANEYLTEYLNRLRAFEEYRKKVAVVITKDEPDKLFEKCHKKSVSVGFSIEELLETLQKENEVYMQSTERMVENLSEKHTGILIPCISAEQYGTSLWGYAACNSTGVIGNIKKTKALGAFLLNTEKADFEYGIKYKQQTVSMEVEMCRKKITPQIKNNNITFDVNYVFCAKMLYGSKKTPYGYTQKDYNSIAKKLEKGIKKCINNEIKNAQNNLKCDYLQFDQVFRVNYPQLYKKISWDDCFVNAKFNVKIDMDIIENKQSDFRTEYKN